MLDEVGLELKRWFNALPGTPEVRFQLPGSEASSAFVSLYFIDIRQKPPTRDALRATRLFHLRYLVSAAAPDSLVAQRLLGDALIAAIEREDVDVDSEPPPMELWRALGVPPQPAFLLGVPWHHEKELPRATTISQPVELHTRRLRRLTGRVVGPNDVPIMSATVELPALGRLTMTDHRGWFDLAMTPRGMNLQLRVTAKGRVIENRVDDTGGAETEVVVNFPPEQIAGSVRAQP